jgi:hypothetical protein
MRIATGQYLRLERISKKNSSHIRELDDNPALPEFQENIAGAQILINDTKTVVAVEVAAAEPF